MNETDFHINQTPVSISLCCPHCYTDVEIPWDEIDVPDYWGDDWGYIDCPYCEKSIKLADYDIG